VIGGSNPRCLADQFVDSVHGFSRWVWLFIKVDFQGFVEPMCSTSMGRSKVAETGRTRPGCGSRFDLDGPGSVGYCHGGRCCGYAIRHGDVSK
jgi:hypothetical protein